MKKNALVTAFLCVVGLLLLIARSAMSPDSQSTSRLSFTAPYTVTVSTTFTPLHTYFMATSGCSDANAGTSAGAPWCSLKSTNSNMSSLVCGDVIVAATGTYNSNNFQITNTPGSCPSVSGGIDGAGGIYAAVILCAGNVGQCAITDTSNSRSVNFNASYWAIEGFAVTNTGNGVAFAQDCTSNTLRHHLFFINNVVYDTGAGFSFGTCGGTGSWDYVAVVGNIAQKANTHSACTSSLNFVVPKNFDSGTETRVYADSNYVIKGSGNAGCTSDGNGIIADTFDQQSYTGQAVFSNNIVFTSRQYGIHIFSQENTTVNPLVYVLNNTTYDNGNPTVSGSFYVGEITQQNVKFRQVTQNNISRTSAASRNGATLYAFQANSINSQANTVATTGGTGNENIFKGSATVCNSNQGSGGCDAGKNVIEDNGSSFGTNTYTDPAFNNVTDLINNQSGTPDCTAFENVTQCMGWNAVTATLTNPSVIYDLTPSAGGMTAKGFQSPTMACAANALFPAHLKGIVYLRWTGSVVQQRAGLAKVPCGK